MHYLRCYLKNKSQWASCKKHSYEQICSLRARPSELRTFVAFINFLVLFSEVQAKWTSGPDPMSEKLNGVLYNTNKMYNYLFI